MLAALSDTDADVLSYLATTRETSRYELKNKIDRAYSGIYRSISKLNEMKLITVTRVEPNQRNREVEVKYYSLTNLGLFNTLGLVKTWENIDQVAETHKDKYPLVFGKWSFYKKNNILEIIKQRLYNGVLAGINILQHTPAEYIEEFDSEDEIIHQFENDKFQQRMKRLLKSSKIIRHEPKTALTQAVFGTKEFQFTSEKKSNFVELKKIWEVCKKDKELYEYYLQEINDDIKAEEKVLDNLILWRKIILIS